MVYTGLILKDLQLLRCWCVKNLPIENSYVAYDILLTVAAAAAVDEQITVKHLFNSVPHSYTAVRMHYKRLINDGWFELVADEKDHRVKYVVPSKQFTVTINDYMVEIKKDMGSKYTDTNNL